MARENKPGVTGDLTASAPGSRRTGVYGGQAAAKKGFDGDRVTGKPRPPSAIRQLSAAISEAWDALAASLTGAAAPPPPAPSGVITQFLTSDGGQEAYSGNFSGPTKEYWHRRLGMSWKRSYPNGHINHGLGNWLDAGQVAEGSAPFGSSSAITTVGQTVSIDATTLVQRWLTTGENRGAYLMTGVSAWPVVFHGRLDPTEARRPRLTVVTTAGTFVLTAAANASWNSSTFSGSPGAVQFTVAAEAGPAIVRFNLATVTGTLLSATLALTVKALSGTTGQILRLYEADPPTIIVPEGATAPRAGIASGLADFAALKASANADKLFADDFESPGWADAGFTPPATRVLNPDTGTIYARGTIPGGGPAGSGTGSANVRRDVSAGTGVRGTPDVVIDELYGQFAWYMESNFGTVQDDAIKIPAMGVQFGYWNPVGYWQQTTGNGGSPGTGLKVDNGGGSNFEYQGHSVRFLTGNDARPLDDDPYRGWFGISIYPYNLDQESNFPASEQFPYIAVRKEHWYTFEIRVKQNTMSGAQDALGNYETANADGIYQVWINDVLAYSKTSFRWRRHPEMGVQGMWIDVYHGGQTPALVDMNYRVDRVVLSRTPIGLTAETLPIPAWVPPPGDLNVLTNANGGFQNHFRDAVDTAKGYVPFYSKKIFNDFAGTVVAPDYGPRGAILAFGGGHSATNDNMVVAIMIEEAGLRFRRVVDPTNWFPADPGANNITSNIDALIDPDWKDSLAEPEKPTGPHSYKIQGVLGPEYGGGPYGTFINGFAAAVAMAGYNSQAAHALPLLAPDAPSGGAGSPQWQRFSATANPNPGPAFGAPLISAVVGSQMRQYQVPNGGGTPGSVRWLDLVTGQYVTGTGVGFGYDGGEGQPGDVAGTLVYIPERELLVCIYRLGGVLRFEWMDVSVAQPTLGGVATLSQSLPVPLQWSCAEWVPTCRGTGRIVLAGITDDAGAFYEVEAPATLTNTWPVERAPLPGGKTFVPVDVATGASNSFGKFGWHRSINAIVYVGTVVGETGDETGYVYTPRSA